ncbi:hypothetical protein QBZ16_002330 [Prototheca wickerhamii]|uniref:Uncharacterized protein n=1 Tax=Prototheca wickerhamii TaxID=3111 RepID=A0AAD9MLM0_PROWI|nr:hypothetical protein QBZ16_002330 [Prototheca wickerhamii]
MDIGIGRWVQILGTGLLPGKLIQQLYGATQRLLGQQSLAAFTGLRLDVDRIRAENEARTDAPRKSGLIIYDGPPLTREERDVLHAEAKEKCDAAGEGLVSCILRYSLTKEQVAETRAAVQQLLESRRLEPPQWQTHPLLATPAEDLSRDALVKLLSDLHGALGRLRGQLATAMARRRRITKVSRPASAEGQAGGGAVAGGGEAPVRPARRPATKTKRAKPRKKRALSDTESDGGDDWEW